MTITQKRILTGLALITILVCVIAFYATRSALEPNPTPFPTQILVPSATPLPTLTPTPRPDVGDEYGAMAICKKFVKDRLIAPRDAKWPGLFDDTPTTIQLDIATWRVKSWVDATNRMGVHIHTEYVCDVYYLGDSKWRLEALDFQD